MVLLIACLFVLNEKLNCIFRAKKKKASPVYQFQQVALAISIFMQSPGLICTLSFSKSNKKPNITIITKLQCNFEEVLISSHITYGLINPSWLSFVKLGISRTSIFGEVPCMAHGFLNPCVRTHIVVVKNYPYSAFGFPYFSKSFWQTNR